MTVRIRDENDNAPVFVEIPIINIREDEPVGTIIGRVSARDADEQGTPNQLVRYRIVGGTGRGVFAINDVNGDVTIDQQLNFENVSIYDLTITASDLGSPSLNSSITLTITIRDSDDHNPLFTRFSYNFVLRENNAPQQFVGRVRAVDVDPLNRSIGYNFSSDAPPNLPFVINVTTGEIYVTEVINRESDQLVDDPRFMFNIDTFYIDQPNAITDEATVVITILDENEFVVDIQMVALMNVTENIEVGQMIGNIIAFDPDPDSILEYSLTVARDVLRVDNATGDIYTDGDIDRESSVLFPPRDNACPPNVPRNTSCIQVFVRVVDQTTGDTNAALAYLFVLDVDDEPPVFSQQIYSIDINESVQVGDPLTGLDIQATDPDFNISLVYSIPASEEVIDFSILPFSGLVLVERIIDYEIIQGYSFTIVVTDSNGNQDNATVEINVLDVNDNDPFFDQEFFAVAIPETYPIRDVVAVLNATDIDSTTNGQITYSITAGNEDEMFNIDSRTGAVSLVQSLDREISANYTLLVVASDAGTPVQRTATAVLSITIEDIVDSPPRFLQMTYTGFVSERAISGDPVLDNNSNPLVITFEDLDVNDEVTVLSFAFGAPISIDEMSGAVTVVGALDFEEQTVYRITVILRDSVNLYSAPATVTINVLPVNDHSPEFERDVYMVSVEENSRQGDVIVRVVAEDRDESDVVVYHIQSSFNSSDLMAPEPGSAEPFASGDGEEITFPFEINNSTGEIFLLRNLDYEVLQEWSFTIIATDREGLNDSARVVVTVEDLNDNAPRFTEHIYEVNVLENTTASRTVPIFTRILAIDLDSVSEDRLQYFVLGGGEGLFELNRDTGYLYLVDGPLDPTRVYTLQILVTDGQQEDAAHIRVHVTDINNNDPMFTQDDYMAFVSEDAPVNTFVVQVEATDMDQNIFSDIKYYIISSEYSNLFYINELTGEIYTNSTEFDFDNPPREYFITVEAIDGADPPRRSEINVTIALEDVNDNPPVFDSNTFTVTIAEDTSIGTSILRVTATDADSGINKEVFFHFPTAMEEEEEQSGSGIGSGMIEGDSIQPVEEESDGGMFILEPSTGILRVNSSLDFDDPDADNPIILDVLVTDRGNPPFTSNATVVIYIVDSNDNAPYFNRTLIRELVPEDSQVGDLAFTAQAFDRDTGLNKEVTYDVLSVYPADCTDRFRIVSETGEVFLNQLVDAEARGEPCTMIIQATDRGSPPLSGQATFVVIVTNINEHSPMISTESLNGSVFENSPNGTFVLQIMTSDLDGNMVTVLAEGEAARFFDVTENGTVTVADNVTLDREIVPHYFLNVLVMDDGLPELVVPAIITINILDENDNAPIFNQSQYTVSVREDHALFSPPIIFVQATDADIGINADVVHSFISNDESETDYGIFDIDSKTGAIFLTSSLDYETEPRFYYLRVQASDGEFTTETNISISVLEANDITPSFTNLPNVTSIPEDLSNGSLIYTAVAVDMDEGVFGMITYTLQGSDKFTIHPSSGEIFVNGDNQFDFDEGQRRYTLMVTATDNADMNSNEFGEAPFDNPLDRPRNMSAQLIIEITDINDNAPQFTEASYTALIIEHDQVPLLVRSVQAFDDDEPGSNNSMVRYRITGGDFGKFEISNTTGVISTIPPIDREAPELSDVPRYSLVIEAYDLGVPSMSSSVIVTVTVIDTNDENPVFTVPVFVGSVDENSPPGTSVLTVSAIDPDNFVAPLNYSIFDADGYFVVDRSTGVIFTTARNLDREEIQNVSSIRVQATDENTLTGVASVNIYINDVNDEAPKFVESSYSFTINEDVYRSFSIGRTAAIDIDSPENAITEYVIPRQNDFFHVDASDGVIRATGNVCFDDREVIVYNFDLVARDALDNNLNSTVPITITVNEQNRYPPVFVRPSYISRLDEEAPMGTVVIEQLQTIDRDGCSGPPIFEIIDGNMNDTFQVDSVTGRISLTRNLLADDLGFTLTLRATDTGNFITSNRSSDVTLIVLVGQLLPVSIAVQGGFTVPAISRFSQEEYQQDIWLYNGGSSVSPDPVVRYSLGNIVAEERIPSNRTQAISVEGVVVQNEIYRDDPYVRIGLQVEGPSYEKVSVLPTEVFVLVRSSEFGEIPASCVTQPPSATCVAEVPVPSGNFLIDSTAEVFYGLSSDNISISAGNISVVATTSAADCTLPSAPYVRVELPHLVLYPGDYYNISINSQTVSETDSFHFTCTASEGLDFVEFTSVPSNYIISTATSYNYATISGLRNPDMSGLTQLEVGVRMFLQPSANITSDVLDIICTVDYLINVNDMAEIYNSPANHTDFASCQSNAGTVLASPNTVVALFPFPRYTSLLNTAVLNGRQVESMLNIFGLTKSGSLTRSIPQLTCESSDVGILKVEADCSRVYLDGNETSDAALVTIEAMSPSASIVVPFRVWYPTAVLVRPDVVELSPIQGLYVTSNGSCMQAYEYINLDIEAAFTSGTERQPVSVASIVGDIVESSDEDVLSVEFDSNFIRLVGVSAGLAQVQLTDNQGRIFTSPNITVTETSVSVEELSLSLYSSLVPRVNPPSLPGMPYLETALVALRADLEHIDVELEVIPEAVLSNSRNYPLSPSNGLVLSSNNPETLAVDDELQVTVRGSGTGQILQGRIQSSCPSSEVLSTAEFVDISINPVASVEVMVLGATSLALRDDSVLLATPYHTSYSVELVHLDRTRVTITSDARLQFQSEAELAFEEGVLDASNVSSPGLVNFTVSYSYNDETVLSDPVFIEIVGVQSISLTASPYPIYSQWPNEGDLLLERFSNTSVYQQAELTVTASLSNGTSIDVSSSPFVRFESSGEASVDIQDGVVEPSSPGNVSVYAFIDSRFNDSIELQVNDSEVYATQIIEFSIPQLSGVTLSATSGAILRPMLAIRFSDGTYNPRFVDTSGFALPNTVELTFSGPNAIEVNQDGTITVQRNAVEPVSLTASILSGSQSSTIQFFVDLVPQLGEIDLVLTSPPPYAPSEIITGYLVANIDGYSLGAAELIVYYNQDVLQLNSISAGSDVSADHVISQGYGDSPGSLRFGAIFPTSVSNTTSAHIFTLDFTAQQAIAVSTEFNILVVTLTEGEEPYSTIGQPTPRYSLPASYSPEPALYNFTDVVPCSSPPCSQDQCTAMNGLSFAGDANGDCVFNLADALYANRVLARLNLPNEEPTLLTHQLNAIDANKNGIYDPADVLMLVEGRMGRFPLIHNINLVPIDFEDSDCVLTINVTLQDWNGDLNEDAFMFFGLFHSNSTFQTQYDNTSLTSGQKLTNPRPADHSGGWIEAENHGLGTYGIRTDPGTIAQTDIGFILIYGTLNPSGEPSNERTQFLFGIPSIPSAYSSLSVTFTPLNGLPSVSTSRMSVNPLIFFDNTINATYCSNNYPPVITFPLSILLLSYPESSPVGTTIRVISATDEDAPLPAGDVLYSLEDVNPPDTIAINATTGEIFIAMPLDREQSETVTATIVATDQGPHIPSRMRDTLNMRLNINDVNDNAPLASESFYSVRVLESLPVTGGRSVPILQFSGNDRDTDEVNHMISSVRVTEGDDRLISSTFGAESVDPINSQTGNFVIALYLLSGLDREMVDMYNLTLTIIDSGNPSLSSSVNVVVQVIDANDLRPDFTSPNRVSLMENNEVGVTILTVTAVDNDIGSNALFNFSLNSVFTANDVGVAEANALPLFGYFVLDPITGDVVANRTFDREGEHSFVLNVIAEEEGIDTIVSAVQNIWIMICDENDNAPLFDEDIFYADIPENSIINTIAIRLNASDADLGPFCLSNAVNTTGNNIIRYELLTEDVPFTIASTTGEILVNGSLDFESSTTEYNLQVRAYDLGEESLSSTTNVTIRVTDVNDNPPVLNQDVYYNVAVEDNAVGTVVIDFINYMDDDKGVNQVVNFQLKGPGSDDFAINVTTGVISIARQLDRERQEEYNLTVIAFNTENPIFSDMAYVRIEIIDINDTPPMFNASSYTARVSENVPIGTVALTVFATDADENRVITYELIEPSNEFDINPQTGEIFTLVTLCTPINTSYTLVVTALDNPGGMLTLSTNVSVTILVYDDNSFAPVFTRAEYVAIVEDGIKDNISIVRVEAIDEDTCSPPFTYSIADNTPFYIDNETGVIYTASTLLQNVDDEYFVTVAATDSGTDNPRTGSATVIVLIGETVPVDFTTDIGFKISEPRKVTENDTEIDFYEQGFDFFYDYNSIDLTPTVQVDVSFGDTVLRQNIELAKLPATRVNAVLLTPTIPYDKRVVQVAMIVTDQYGSNRVDETTVFVNVSTEIDGRSLVVSNSQQTEQEPLSDAIVSVELPLEWFFSERNVSISYGVEGNSPSQSMLVASLIPFPEFEDICENTTAPFLLVLAPSYSVYANEVVEIPVVAWQTTEYPPSSVALDCTVGSGLRFNSIPVSVSSGWEIGYELNPSSSQLRFTTTRQTNVSSLLSYEFVAQMSIVVGASSIDSSLITCTNLDAVDVSGNFERFSEALLVDSNGCRPNTGRVTITENVLVGALPTNGQTVLVNDAVLSGNRAVYFPSVAGVILSAQPRITSILVNGLPLSAAGSFVCTSTNDNVLKVEADCSQLYMDGTESSGAETVHLTVDATNLAGSEFSYISSSVFPIQLEYHVWYPDLPVSLTSTDSELSPIEGWMRSSDDPLSTTCEQEYQRADIYATTTFRLGSSSVSLRVENLLDIQSSNTTVARVTGSTVTGVSPGTSVISAFNTRRAANPIIGSFAMTTLTSPVRAVELDTIYASNFTVNLPESLPYTGPEPFVAMLDPNLWYETQTADIVSTAVFSDATRLRVSPNDGLRYATLNTSVVKVTGSTLTAVSSGSGDLLQVTWNSCGNSQVLSQDRQLDISLLVPEIRLTVPNIVLVHSSDPAANLPTSTSTRTTITVEQVSRLGDEVLNVVDITTRGDTVYSFNPEGVLSIDSDGTITVLAQNVNTTVTLSVSNPLSIPTNVTFYTVYSSSLSTSPSPYPSYTNSGSVELTVLHPVASTGVYQSAQISALLTLSVPEDSGIQRLYDVTGRQSVISYSVSPSSVATVSSEGILTPTSTGNVRVTISAPPLQSVEDFVVISSPTLVSSIDRVQLSSGSDTVIGQRGEVSSATLSVSVTLSDGTRIEEVFTPAGQVYPSLLTVSSNDPTLFTVSPSTGQLTVLESRHTPVSLIVTTNQNTNTMSEILPFYINIEPLVGELDIGNPSGRVVPPVASGQVFDVPVRLNIDQAIDAFEIGVAYSYDMLELVSVSAGSDLPSSVLFENSLREFEGYVYFGGIATTQTINSGVLELAVLTFRARSTNNRLATISGEIISLLDRSEPSIDIKPSPPRDVTVGVFIGNEISNTALPDVEMQRTIAGTALAPTVTPCLGGVPINGREVGDLNSDCVFNISDVLYFQRTGCIPNSDRDFNRDGFCDETDVLFMLRANYRIVQFIGNVTVSPVNPLDCFLTIDATLSGRGSPVANGARTNLLFGLFSREGEFQQQFDATNVFIGVGNAVEFVGNQPPSTNGGFFNASEIGVNEFRVVLNTPISNTKIGLVIVQARVDSYQNLVVSRTEVHTGYQSIPIQYPQYINSNIVHPTGVYIPFQFQLGFNPLQFFNQTFTSPDCINNEGPRFFPNVSTVEHYEDIRVGSVVAVVFANDTDVGPNAEVVYSLYSASNEIRRTFQINATTGEVILLSSLNREETDIFFIGLQALDRGVVNPRRGIGELIVRVLDVNDERPVFEQDPYVTRNVPEDADIDYLVVTVRANDRDIGENGTVSYTLLEPKYAFEINSTTGDITTRLTLDYEAEQQYMLVVQASDDGSPSLSSNTTVIVNIDPVNDNAPNCYPTERIALLSESESNGTAFFLVNVSDADLGANHRVLTFALAEESNEFSVVKINDTHAMLVTITEDLNRLLQPLYNLTIIVSDVDGQSCSVQVSVIVVEPLVFDFTIERPGAGFFSSSTQHIRQQNNFIQKVSFFGNSFNNGTISGSLSGQSSEVSYTRTPQPPTRLDGILHEDEVWPDNPLIAAAIQLRDSSFNTLVDDTEVFLQIIPSNSISAVSPVSGRPCEREDGSVSGICDAEVEVPSSWFTQYSSVTVIATTSTGVSVILGQVSLMLVSVDVSGFTENLVVEIPSYTLYLDTQFVFWVGASPSIDIKAFQFSLRVPLGIELGSIINDEKWGCTHDYDETNRLTNFVCFRAHPGQSQSSLIGTDRFFGVQAYVRFDTEDLDVEAEVISVASAYGSVISAPRPALVFTRNNISNSPGMLNVRQEEVRGIFATTERPELVNTVPLNGEPIAVPVTTYTVYDRRSPRYVPVTNEPVSCSSSDPNLSVQYDCDIALTSNFTSCRPESAVEVTHVPSSSRFSLPIRIWCYNRSEIDLSDPILDRVRNWKTSDCSEDRFQQSRFRIWGRFAAGNQLSARVDITEYLADAVMSSNESVAIVDVDRKTVSGVAVGEALIFVSSLPDVSTTIEVIENFVEVYSLVTNIFTSVSLQVTPSAYAPASSVAVSALLETSFGNTGVEGYTASYVYFTDGALYIIPQSSLNITTVTPDTVTSTSDGIIQSVSQGTAEIEISWIPSECAMQDPLANDVTTFEVTTPVPVEIELEISEEVIAGNTRGVLGLGVATFSGVMVSLVYSDGTSRSLSPSEYTITSSPSLIVTDDGSNSGSIVMANSSINTTSGMISVSFTSAAGEIHKDATFSIVNALSAEIILLSYPDGVRQSSNIITLELLSVTNILQQAQVYSQVSLSNGSIYSIIPTSYVRGGSGSVSIDNDGVVTGLSPGGVTLDFSVGEFNLPRVTVDVSGARVELQSISGLALEDRSATQKRVVVDLTFSDGMVINDIANYQPQLLSLVQFSVAPAGIATINETTLILNITSNYYDRVNLTATTTASNIVSETVLFAANLEPEVGQLDIGQAVGVPQPPVNVNGLFSTDIRVNLGEDEDIGAYHLVTAYNPTEVAALSVNLSLPGLYFINADTTSGVIHTVYLSVFGFEVEESEPTIVTFNYRALRNNTLTRLSSDLRVLVDRSINQITTHGLSSIDVLIGSVASSRRRRDSPRVPRQTSSPFTSDFNGDSVVDIADAAYLMRYIGEGEGSVSQTAADANQDGAITVADVLFLARASVGLVPFLDQLAVTAVSSDSDCSLNIQADVTFATEEFTDNDTSVYFILSHPQFKNEIQLSNTLVGSQLPISDATSVIFKAVALQERGAYRLSLNTPLDRQATNVGVSVAIFTEDDDTISSGLDRLALFTKSQMRTFVSDNDLVPALKNVSLEQSLARFDVLDPDGFSPFETFTNNKRSDYCRFAGREISIELLENARVGTAVYNFTAYEPPFPSFMENYTIVNSTTDGHFILENDTGVLRLAQSLDFETIPFYTLIINAYSEQGDYSIGMVTLNITVLDLNDFAPVFIDPESYAASLYENTVANASAPILTVSAFDLDDGINGQFYFSLVDTSGTFNISTLGEVGEIYLTGPLDRETTDLYNLTVYVIDMGTQIVLNSSAPVIINVLDINDNSPVFNETVYNVMIRENIFMNTENVIVQDFQIVATDADLGSNAIVLLTLDPDNLEPSKPFSLNSAGILSVISPLDRESRASYNYTVEARDMGMEPLYNFVELNIIIEDSNDHAPVFLPSNDMMITLEEDVPVGTSITQIQATDDDIGSNMVIFFSILPTNVPFSIHPDSGVITVSQRLSVSNEYQYVLTIIANNSLGDVPQSTNSSIIINVIEKQVITFDAGDSGLLIGEPQRLVEGRRYIQQVGALFNEDIGTPVSVSGGINTATSGEIDQAEIANIGDVAVTVKGSVFDSRVRHSLRTVTAFVQAYDARDVIARPTLIQVSVSLSAQLRDVSSVDMVSETCTTSEDLGFCIVRIQLPDEWFARDATVESTDTVSVWANIAGQARDTGILIADGLVVEHSPAFAISFSINPILVIAPSHEIYPNQTFSLEVYIVSPLDSPSLYDRVQTTIITTNAVASLVGINYDENIWNCCE